MDETKVIMQELIAYAKTKTRANVYYREDWECEYFAVMNKCFGRMDQTYITLKGDPLDNGAMREIYEDIIPGYYANKIHWNSIKLNTKELSIEDIKRMIDTSYDLVVKKLTKKEKMLLENK